MGSSVPRALLAQRSTIRRVTGVVLILELMGGDHQMSHAQNPRQAPRLGQLGRRYVSESAVTQVRGQLVGRALDRRR